ncbi:MAG: DMT family transporter [Tannerella sp.]|jgi:transporter family protein|nr:DMT family transporter [Tannerella sp.]
MWITLAFLSALALGCYDTCKKHALTGNAVIPVLFAHALLSAALFAPLVLLSQATDRLDASPLHVPRLDAATHARVGLKAVIVLASWICGYFAVKHLPLTVTGPVKATQPVMTLAGAMILFGERLNICQWTGVALAALSFILLSVSGKKEGIRFLHSRWIACALLSTLLGAASGLYDKHLMTSLDVVAVQAWFNIYQFALMIPVLFCLWYPLRRQTTPWQWRSSILGLTFALAAADWIYFHALSQPGAMISVISMIRRSSVAVTFIAGATLFHEKNLKSKIIDLILVLSGMIFLYLGTK